MDRPKCRRCGGPLDLFREDGGWALECNNLQGRHTPAQTDDEFAARWDALPGDDVVRLERQLEL